MSPLAVRSPLRLRFFISATRGAAPALSARCSDSAVFYRAPLFARLRSESRRFAARRRIRCRWRCAVWRVAAAAVWFHYSLFDCAASRCVCVSDALRNQIIPILFDLIESKGDDPGMEDRRVEIAAVRPVQYSPALLFRTPSRPSSCPTCLSRSPSSGQSSRVPALPRVFRSLAPSAPPSECMHCIYSRKKHARRPCGVRADGGVRQASARKCTAADGARRERTWRESALSGRECDSSCQSLHAGSASCSEGERHG